jgi:alpha-tubulin suppressor-like RCC1 family protein
MKSRKKILNPTVLILCLTTLLTISARGCVNRSKTKVGSSNNNTFMLNAPSRLTAMAVSSSQIDLSWQDNSNNEDGFEIERSTNGSNFQLLTSIGSNITSYSNTSVSPFTTYYYRVMAFNTIGDRSGYSNVVNAIFIPAWLAVAAGSAHSIALTTEGNIYTWGANAPGQLGLGDNNNRLIPTEVVSDSNGNVFDNISAIAASFYSTIILRRDGTIWTCGNNDYGQLGLGDYKSANTPFPIIGVDSDWFKIAAGGFHTLALKTIGTIWVWGWNGAGQLGLGDGIERVTPTQLGTLSDWFSITAGYGHTLSIKTNGTLWAWGYNWSGELGLGNSPSRNTPTQIGSLSDWSVIAASGVYGSINEGFSIAIKTNRTLWSWGDNQNAQLGQGNTDYKWRLPPRQIGTESNWSIISAGGYHTIAQKTNGTLWGWGSNEFGQLGLGDNTQRSTPSQIGTDSDWFTIRTGGNHSVALKNNSTLWTWGNNSSGQLGFGDTADRNKPYLLGSPAVPLSFVATAVSSSQIDLSWTDISVNALGFIIERKTGYSGSWEQIVPQGGIGPDITFYSDTGLILGTTYYYRVIAFNKFGNSPYSVELNSVPIIFTPTNLALTVVSSTQINLSWQDNSPDEIGFKIQRKIGSAGIYADIATVNDNVRLYSNTNLTPNINYYYRVKAYNISGESALSNEENATPTLFAPTSLIVTVISTTRIGLVWNDNSIDETGFNIERKIGEVSGTYEQIAIVGTNVISWSDIGTFSPGIYYYYRVRAYNDFGDSPYSNEVSIVLSGNWYAIAAKSAHNIALKADPAGGLPDNQAGGTLWAWGHNGNGQLGDGTTIMRTTPRQIGIASDWSIITAGGSHTISLKTNKTLWVWGNNINGQLGLGDAVNRTTPVLIGFASDWSTVAAGQYYTIALKTPGTLWAWGYNCSGQLGIGNNNDKNTPAQIGNDSDWSKIAAGAKHSISLKTNSTLWAWGFNQFGQLGDGAELEAVWDEGEQGWIWIRQGRLIPTQIGIDTDWSMIAGGWNHTFALKTNPDTSVGTLWAWGSNYYGQLGLGDTGDGTDRNTPTQVGNNADWSSIATGEYHTIALQTNPAGGLPDNQAGGTLWVWGWNLYGQLGLGNAVNRTTPCQIGIASDWSIITAGVLHTISLKTNKTLWAWGYNSCGQLGLGDTINKNTPMMVRE